MIKKLQSTTLRRTYGQLLLRIELWANNPWRRYSLFLILLLTGFWIGSSLGTINGVLALMDPVGAFITVVILEVMVRMRRHLTTISSKEKFALKLIDMIRIGLLYGLLLDGFKLL